MELRPAPEPGSAAGASYGGVGVVDVVAFVSELAVFALLAVAGWNLAEPLGPRLALAVSLPVLTIGLWGLLLAPRSRRRLPQPVRLVAQLVIFAASGALAVGAGLGAVGWVVPSAACLVFAAVFLGERRGGGTTGRS